MEERKKLNVLSISFYGSDLITAPGKAASGTLERQFDYAQYLDKYIVICPLGKGEAINLKENFSIYPIDKKNRLRYFLSAYALARRLIKEQAINCLFCDNPFDSALIGVMLKAEFKLPLLVHSMAQMIDNPRYLSERPFNFLKNWLARFNLRFADILRVSTDAEVSDFRGRFKNKPIVYNQPFYIDFSGFEELVFDQELRERLTAEEFDKIILYVGRFAKQKDLPTLIRAAALVIKKYPKALFTLIGTGPEFDSVKQLIEELQIGKNIRLLGKVPYVEVKKYFTSSDLFAITSIYEGTCMVLHEAAISRLPIVSTAHAGAIDLIRDNENGFLAPIGDAQTVAEKIGSLIEHDEERKAMGQKNREIVKSKFSREIALEKFKAMLEIIKKL